MQYAVIGIGEQVQQAPEELGYVVGVVGLGELTVGLQDGDGRQAHRGVGAGGGREQLVHNCAHSELVGHGEYYALAVL